MFVNYLTGPFEPKSEESATPGYHVLWQVARGMRYWMPGRVADVPSLLWEAPGSKTPAERLELGRG